MMAQIMYKRFRGGTMPFSLVASTPVPLHEPNRAESLAAALELQRVGDDANPWVVHVLGVHDDGHHLWVQIASNADGTDSIVLRLSIAATARHVLATLASLSRSSLACSAVVPVMCTV
jgi:hypothetical protein